VPSHLSVTTDPGSYLFTIVLCSCLFIPDLGSYSSILFFVFICSVLILVLIYLLLFLVFVLFSPDLGSCPGSTLQTRDGVLLSGYQPRRGYP